MDEYMTVWKKYADFSGRARRKEYWYFVLVNWGISVVFSIANTLSIQSSGDATSLFGILSIIYSLAILVPSLAVFTRRMHDTGRSGWWFLLNFIPLVGAIILIVYLAQDSQPGPNQYGPNPKTSIVDNAFLQ